MFCFTFFIFIFWWKKNKKNIFLHFSFPAFIHFQFLVSTHKKKVFTCEMHCKCPTIFVSASRLHSPFISHQLRPKGKHLFMLLLFSIQIFFCSFRLHPHTSWPLVRLALSPFSVCLCVFLVCSHQEKVKKI